MGDIIELAPRRSENRLIAKFRAARAEGEATPSKADQVEELLKAAEKIFRQHEEQAERVRRRIFKWSKILKEVDGGDAAAGYLMQVAGVLKRGDDVEKA